MIEAWGTGFKRIRNAAKEYGLPEPEFIEMPESFRVNLYRKSASFSLRAMSSELWKHTSRQQQDLRDGFSSIMRQMKTDSPST